MSTLQFPADQPTRILVNQTYDTSLASPTGRGMSASPDAEIDESVYLRSILWIYLGPFIFAIGVVGNLLIVVVVGHSSMRGTSTCTYLKWMAVADVFTLVTGMIPEWLDYMGIFVLKEYHEVACKLEKFVNFTSVDTSIWICVVFTLERFIAVCFPMSEFFFCQPANAKAFVGVAFLAAIVKNVHILWTRGAEYAVAAADAAVAVQASAASVANLTIPDGFVSNCGSPTESYRHFEKFIRPWIAFVSISLVPCLVIAVCNVFIVRSLFLLRLNRNKIPADSESGNVRQMTILCLTASICFLVCNTPSMILLIGKPYWGVDNNAKYKLAKPVINQIFYVNHSINFFLYCITGKRFRQSLGQIFRSHKHPSATYEISRQELLETVSSRLSSRGPRSRARLSTSTSLCLQKSSSSKSNGNTFPPDLENDAFQKSDERRQSVEKDFNENGEFKTTRALNDGGNLLL